MNELDTFLESMLPRLTAADTALHNGDASDRTALWSRDDPRSSKAESPSEDYRQ